MARYRDVRAFHDRAPGYEAGWRGRMHRQIAERTIDLALAAAPEPARVLDVGCGTGLLLRALAERLPEASELVGVDPAPAMVEVAAGGAAGEPRLRFVRGEAEHLPLPKGHFELVVSTTSFHHWADQGAGLAECARVLAPGGRFVLTDVFSWWRLPAPLAGQKRRAQTVRRTDRLLAGAGFERRSWHRLYLLIVRTVAAAR